MKRVLFLILPIAAAVLVWSHFHSSAPVETTASAVSEAPAETAAVGAPSAPKAAQVISPVSTPSKPVAETWKGFNSRIKKLGDNDQQALDDLYAEAAQVIHAQEKEVDQYLAQSVPAIVDGSLEESFFTVGSWVRYASAPAAVLAHLWDYTPPTDPVDADPHHAAFTPAFRYNSLQSYALGELRKRFQKDGINLSASERENLVKSLIARASSEKSINQSLEIFETLLALGEKKAVLDSLSTRSERDRKLIAETLGLTLES